MNRNTEMHFKDLPEIDFKRSRFDMSHSNKTTFNVGQIIPIDVQEILPGDTESLDMAEVVRMATPIYPVMDNLIMDTYSFFVPTRLTWEHWEEFWGQNDDPWSQQTEYNVPMLEAPEGGWNENTIADYMGIPTEISNIEVSALPFRAYTKIINDWFRDENVQYASALNIDDTNRTGSNGNNYVTDIQLGGKPAIACKTHDYFTSALPSPQKGPAVTLPLGTEAPVLTGPNVNYNEGDDTYPLRWGIAQNGDTTTIPWPKTIKYVREPNGGLNQGKPIYMGMKHSTAGQVQKNSSTNYKNTNEDVYNEGNNNIIPINLYTDLNNATSATINQLRTAFAIQKYYEAAGRNGTRYIEYLRSVFGVTSSDARLQRAEYLGGERIPINMDQVLQTSATDAVTPQGNTAGFSCTINNKSMYTKSFEEHGYRIILAVVRVAQRTYQQGLNRMWSRKSWLDFYNPYFANLGEQAILNKEIYANGTTTDEEAFGYQEAWADYRYRTNMVTGHMRSNSNAGSLDAWHYADEYNTVPSLSETWIVEPTENIDRTLAVQSENANQIIGDFYFKSLMTRVMPVYSIPGLIDHV